MKFFFDNNISPNLASAINALTVSEDYDVTHLRQKFSTNTPDIDWIASLAKEGEWTIISGDSRISKNKHEREVWRRAGLTTFFLAPGWMNIGFWEQSSKFVRWWPRIVEQTQFVQPGAVFEIPVRYGGGKFKQR